MASNITNVINTYLRKFFGIRMIKVKKKPKKVEKNKFRSKYLHDPVYSYMISPEYKYLLIDELTQVAEDFFLSGELFKFSPISLKPMIEDFFCIYTRRTLTDNTHGSGFHNAFWIYLFSRNLAPELIIESGVWKGHTTWLLEQACPSALILGFDKNLSFVEYDNLKVDLFETDWYIHKLPPFDPEKAFIFFDCHVNNAQRILEAKSRGFKHILIDDNPPVHKIFRYIPGIPTAAMLFADQGIDQTEISWVWNGKEVTRTIDINQARSAKELIKKHQAFPDVGGPTGYGGFDYLTYVQI